MANYIEQVRTKRLFVDMDGTLTVYRQLASVEQLYEPGYFRELPPLGDGSVVQAVREVKNRHPETEVYVLSSVLGDHPTAAFEKDAWLNKYLPEIDTAHRLYPPCGEDKAAYVPGGIQPTDTLLDDYNKNLEAWRQAGGHSVKMVNDINNRGLHGAKWDGEAVRYDGDPEQIAAQLANGAGQVQVAAIDKGQAAVDMNTEGLAVDGHEGTWHSIDHLKYNDIDYYLMEHDVYGDEAAFVVVNASGKLIMEDVWNGLSELPDFLEEEQERKRQDMLNRSRGITHETEQPPAPGTYTLYQLKDTPELRDVSFCNLADLQSRGLNPDPANYEAVYTAPWKGETPEDLWYTFNNEYPSDYAGRSMSVSDVIVFTDASGNQTAQFADSFGFTELPKFAQVKKDDGLTPLHRAALSGDAETVHELLEQGMYVDARDNLGYTPLRYAAQSGNKETEKVLLQHGADAKIAGLEEAQETEQTRHAGRHR